MSAASADKVRAITNNCPECRMPVQREGSNDRMTCVCGKTFCFDCGQSSNPCRCVLQQRQPAENPDYMTGRIRSYVNNNKLKKCPTCHMYVDKDGGNDNVTCFCGTSFCFSCGQEKSICRCQAQQQPNDTVLTGRIKRYIVENELRNCPSCNILIEKVGAGDYVKCACGAHFCYNCRLLFDNCQCRGVASNFPTLPTTREMFECPICAEEMNIDDVFMWSSCGHQFCRDCALQHVRTCMADRKDLNCPQCPSQLEFADAELLLPADLLQQLRDSLNDKLLGTTAFVHCSKPDCRGVAEVVPPWRKFTCPVCRYNMCVDCRKNWHSETCADYAKKLQETEASTGVVLRYMKENNLSRCPNCKSVVEKTKGCDHMTCRCGTEYCYRCSRAYTGSISSHQCSNN